MRVLHIRGDGAEADVAAVTLPSLAGLPSPARLQRIAAAMRGHDLVVTHGWEAINAALAHTVFARHLALPPLVHHEEHADNERLLRRSWTRRLALRSAAVVIVPGERLRAQATGDWLVPAARVRLVPPGIDLAPFARKPRPDALPRLIKRRGERWLGAWAHDDADALLDGLASLPETWHLIWIGEGPARDAIRGAALSRNLAHRVHTPGLVRAADAFPLLDLIALGHEPEPAIVLAAMAAGLAVAAPARTGPAGLLSPQNAAELGSPVARLAGDEAQLRTLGEANRAITKARHDARRTRQACQAIYDEAAATRVG